MEYTNSNPARGADELRRLLEREARDVRRLDVAGFREWLADHLARWQRDTAFAQRVRIRDRRRNYPRLAELERERHRASAADAGSPAFPRLQEVERELVGAGKAVEGLTAAVERAGAAERPGLERKLLGFESRERELRDELEELVRSSPERQELLRVDRELRALRAATGLDREDERLEALLQRQGRRSGRAGASFESTVLALTESFILEDLDAPRDGVRGEGRLHVLRGVTLGAARMELDQVVVRRSGDERQPVEVLALVEAKRNINDLAHGFRRRQENLAWLTGTPEGYDLELYRNRHFPSGHFDQEAWHAHGDEVFRFTRQSFRRFRRDPATGYFLDRLYFVTRWGRLWGVASAVLARIGHRVSTDERWDPGGEAYLVELLEWCRSLADPVETPDVLELYGSTSERGRQILLLERPAAD